MKWASSFRVYNVFTSHMVLQRERPIRISGNADPGGLVKVAFAGREETACADASGEWVAVFPPMSAGGEYAMRISGAAGTPPLELTDILIGDVWFCSGQSNMQMPVGNDEADPFFRAGNYREILADADRPRIRLYNCEWRISPDMVHVDETGAGWQRCGRETLAVFSACGYLFGKYYQQETDVPVGLISCNWGGTDIEAWISAEKFRQYGLSPVSSDEAGVLEEWNKLMNTRGGMELAEWMKRFDAQGHPSDAELATDFDDSSWSPTAAFPLPGRYLCRLTFEMPEELAGEELELALGVIDDADQTYFNGVKVGATGIETPMYWSVSRVYRVPAELSRKGRNCVALVVDDHFNYGIAETGSITLIRRGTPVTVSVRCRCRTIFRLGDDFPVRPPIYMPVQRTRNDPNYPSTLFNGMVYPWFRYNIRGCIWYQGCNNSGAYDYWRLHQMLIEDWRERWHDDAMPFLLVQLAAFHEHRPADRLSDEFVDALPPPEYPPMAIIREIQGEMPGLMEHVGMITAFDCGDHSDIHPRDKETLGRRLAQKAVAMIFGGDRICDGPEFDGMRIEGQDIRVFFKHTGSGLTTSDGLPPRGFAAAGQDGVLHWMDAVIEGDTVLVKGGVLGVLQRVRYAFTGYCRVNLCNREGWPALPFRSDKPDYRKMFHCFKP